MKTKLGGEPAFARASGPEPRVDAYIEAFDGLTKRELFSAMAMQGMLSGHPRANELGMPNYDAEWAVKLADALLEELEKHHDQETT